MKKLCTLILLLTFFFSFSVPCFARNLDPTGGYTVTRELSSIPFKISARETYTTERGLEIRASVPALESLQDAALEGSLNANIQQIYTQKVDAAKSSRAKSISFSYTYKYGSGITSILLQTTTTTANSAKTEIDSVNFNLQKREKTSITDVLGQNGVALSEKVIVGMIKKDPDKYNPKFPGVSENQAFYVENGNIIFIFNEYQVSSGGGSVEFSLRIDAVLNFTVQRSDYETKFDYGLKMIPLRQVCEGLGYTLRWNTERQSVDIRKNNQFVANIIIGQNKYSLERMSLPVIRSLESAPEVINGITYVPISFFDVIMDMTYSVDVNNNNILFTVYQPD